MFEHARYCNEELSILLGALAEEEINCSDKTSAANVRISIDKESKTRCTALFTWKERVAIARECEEDGTQDDGVNELVSRLTILIIVRTNQEYVRY